MPRPSKKQSLFDDKQEPETSAATRLAVNPKFAERYEAQKRKQDLARARELGFDPATSGEIASSSDESEDDGEALTHELDAKVQATIDLIRKKDPRVYDPNTKFFAEKEAVSSADIDTEPKKKKAAKKLTGKDVIREQLLDAVARGAEDAFEEDDEDAGGAGRRRRGTDEDRPAKAYNAEQEALRRAFIETASKDAAIKVDSSDVEESDGLLVARAKKKERTKAKKSSRSDEAGDAEPSVETESVSRDDLKRHLLAKVMTLPS